MNRSTSARRLAGLVAALALIGAGCGNPSSDSADAEAVASPVPTVAASPTPSPTPTPTPTADPTPSPSATVSPTPEPTPTPSPTPKPLSTPTYYDGVEPVRIEIPAIGVDANVVDLAIGPGDPEVPEEWDDAGWYTNTRNPGEIGPSVVAGHIDSKSGPAVFYRLDELVAGDEIIVSGEDGESRTFVVQDSGQYPKENLPDEVFGYGERVPELRVITCGGSFDRSVGHYEDNLVVYAAMDI